MALVAGIGTGQFGQRFQQIGPLPVREPPHLGIAVLVQVWLGIPIPFANIHQWVSLQVITAYQVFEERLQGGATGVEAGLGYGIGRVGVLGPQGHWAPMGIETPQVSTGDKGWVDSPRHPGCGWRLYKGEITAYKVGVRLGEVAFCDQPGVVQKPLNLASKTVISA